LFKIKLISDCIIAKYEAINVAGGFTKEQGNDCINTFAPNVKFSTIQVILALAAYPDWEVEQLDRLNRQSSIRRSTRGGQK
jgi:hypothetical protein